jgi:raffinose/stachyose/melibiose transport system substrate-binding protein
VRIVQDAIPEGTYGQWLTTQLMGGTAPDIIECGLGVPYNVLVGYYSRYFRPMTPYVNQLNPYNAGTVYSNTAWRATYKDAMRGSYIEEIQEFMTVPLSQFGVRIFYNRNLLKKLTGLETPPSNFQQFMKVCDQIKSQRCPVNDQFYTPIASSAYNFGMWDGFMADPMTYSLVRKADFGRDGAVDNFEMLTAVLTGRIDFKMRPYRARFDMVSRLTANFQPGFTGLGRDEAVFLFAQERAVFLTTGTWDQGALREQARGVFEVGVMDFPIPTKDDPEFGDVIEGPVYERPVGGFPFAITRNCKYPEIALDFLMFLGSLQGNERLNQLIGWIPSITGAKLNEDLKAFEPHLQGVFGASQFTLGGETITKWSQVYDLYKVGQCTMDKMLDDFGAFYRQKGPEEYAEMVRNQRRSLAVDEQFVAGMRARALMPAPGVPDAAVTALASKYRQLTAGRLISREFNHGVLRRLQRDPGFFQADPYELTPEALARVRQRLADEAGGKKTVSPE